MVFFDAYPHVFTGAQQATLQIMDGLRARGWSVELAVPAEGPFVEAARAHAYTVTVVPVPGAASRLRAAHHRLARGPRRPLAADHVDSRGARWLRSRADIVHIADHRGQLLIGPAARLARRPVVWHIHGMLTNRALNVIGGGFAEQVLVPSRAAADAMVGIERRRAATIVPYALSADVLAAADRHRPSRPTAVTLTRLHPDKGLDILLRAAAALVDRMPDLRVVIAGGTQDGHERHEAELLELQRALRLESTVEFIGRTDTPRELLLGASVYVQSSRERTELQPIAVLEAMAAGLPVVATRVGGVAEMLGDGEFGTLVAPEDPDALAGALARVFDDPADADTSRRCCAAAGSGRAHCRASDRPDRSRVRGAMTSVLLYAHRLVDPVSTMTGIGRYVEHITKALATVAGEGWQFDAASTAEKTTPAWLPADVRYRRVRGPRRPVHLAWTALNAPRLERLVGPFDLLHALQPSIPLPTDHPAIVTVHDVMPIEHPEWYQPREVLGIPANAEVRRRPRMACDRRLAVRGRHGGRVRGHGPGQDLGRAPGGRRRVSPAQHPRPPARGVREVRRGARSLPAYRRQRLYAQERTDAHPGARRCAAAQKSRCC